ncbi:hypothetical protein ANO14919_037020 [Xylariales sp. No.14919]|nr:hypothetical protein ANO14919_037020 [Xylariales sp. No.14919]
MELHLVAKTERSVKASILAAERHVRPRGYTTVLTPTTPTAFFTD